MQTPQIPTNGSGDDVQVDIQEILGNDTTTDDTPSKAEITKTRVALMKQQAQETNYAHDPQTGIALPPEETQTGGDLPIPTAPPPVPNQVQSTPQVQTVPQATPQGQPQANPQIQPTATPDPTTIQQQLQTGTQPTATPQGQPEVGPDGQPVTVADQFTPEEKATVDRLEELMQDSGQPSPEAQELQELKRMVMSMAGVMLGQGQQPANPFAQPQINPQGFNNVSNQPLAQPALPVANDPNYIPPIDDPYGQQQPQQGITPEMQMVLTGMNNLQNQMQEIKQTNENYQAQQQFESNVQNLMTTNGISRDHAEKAQLYFQNGQFQQGSEVLRLAAMPVITRNQAAIDREMQRDASGQPLSPAMAGNHRTTNQGDAALTQQWNAIMALDKSDDRINRIVRFVAENPEFAALATENMGQQPMPPQLTG